MLNFCLANKYADVLLNICNNNKGVFNECQDLLKILEENCLLNIFFSNKNVTNEEKIKVITSLEGIKSSNNFFKLLIINNRAEYIKIILQLFFQKYEERNKIGRVKIFTVENLQQKEIETFKNLLIKKFDLSQVIIENIIDKTLIGGFVFIFNNSKYDYSLKNNLQHISEMFN